METLAEEIMTNAHGLNYIPWKFDFDCIFNFEIPTSHIKPHLPRGIYNVEVRPGVSILSIAIPQFSPGNLNRLPLFNEISLSIIVHPNMSLMNQVPRFAFYVLNILADHSGFLKHASEIDKMPIYSSEKLVISSNLNDFHFLASDINGPILDLKSSYSKEYQFSAKQEILQVFSPSNGAIYANKVEWEAISFEHQEIGDVGRLFNHPFFLDIDVGNIKPTDCYLQMVTAPTQKGTLKFYQPKKMMEGKVGK